MTASTPDHTAESNLIVQLTEALPEAAQRPCTPLAWHWLSPAAQQAVRVRLIRLMLQNTELWQEFLRDGQRYQIRWMKSQPDSLILHPAPANDPSKLRHSYCVNVLTAADDDPADYGGLADRPLDLLNDPNCHG